MAGQVRLSRLGPSHSSSHFLTFPTPVWSLPRAPLPAGTSLQSATLRGSLACTPTPSAAGPTRACWPACASTRAAIGAVVELLCREQGYGAAAFVAHDGTMNSLVGSMRPDMGLAQRASNRHSVLATAPRPKDGGDQAAP